jgi:hypothetical protein
MYIYIYLIMWHDVASELGPSLAANHILDTAPRSLFASPLAQ